MRLILSIPRLRSSLILGLILCIQASGFAQNYFFDNYSVEDGLANSKIYCIIQDRNHRVWIGTPSGVNIFDGISFQHKNSKDGLAEDGVSTLFEDSFGNIWLGHFNGGITRFNGKTFETLPFHSFLKNSVFSFSENLRHQLWITSDGSGAVRIDNPNAPFKKIKYEHYKGKRLSDRVFGSFNLSDKRTYFITDAGLKVFNEKENNFDNFYIDKMPTFFPVTTMLEDRDGNLWFGTFHGGLYKYIKKQKTFKVYDKRDGLSANWITSICQDHKGSVWVGTFNGITRIEKEKLTVYTSANGLLGDFIYSIIPDSEGNVLIASDQGLSIYKGDFLCFSKPEILPGPQIWSILQDSRKRIWFGTNKGISVYNPGSLDNKFKLFKEADLPVSSKIRFIKEDLKKNIWVGTDDNGVLSFDPRSSRFDLNIEIFYQLPSVKRITAMEADQHGILWIGALDRLLEYNTYSGEIHSFDEGSGLIGSDISAIYVDHSNTKYIGSRGKGITIFTERLSLKSKKDTLLGRTTPNCITTDAKNNIWIGTEGQGLLCYRDGKILNTYNLNNGLLSDIINFVIADNDGFIYAGTSKGLNRIDVKSGTIRSYTRRNGFSGIQANKGAAIKDAEGGLWLGTINGAVHFDPKNLETPAIEPFVRFTRFRVNQEDCPIQNNVSLLHFQNSIILDYHCISLVNPEAVLYQTMMEGAENDWQPVTRETSAKYSPLQPGKYIFKVRARNSLGIWSKPTVFEFSILPPFYKTWWFITLCVVTGLLILLLYIKLRERKLVREKRVLEQKVKERTAEVVAMNHQLAIKNKDLTDSILYASRIQNALLPPDIPIDNTFVMFRPKDIVSGDFFWFLSEDGKDWVAAVDCTGHGVPGAFMSIIGYNSLNKIIKEMGIIKPSEILHKLDAEISNTLHQYQKDTLIQDGMDIALACYDRKNRVLEFSGAFNPLWLVRNNELLEYRANRFAIGMSDIEKNFQNNEISVSPGDTVYLFSDGYADQFGGKHAKKLKTSNFKEIILKLQGRTMSDQKIHLEKAFEEWKGENEQVDDVLVIGWQL